MKSTPLLFKAEMVHAILDGRKTQTRRLVKPQPGDVHFEELPKTDPVTGWQIAGRSYRWSDDDATGRIWTPPIGVPGDQIWVKETFAQNPYAASGYIYRATERYPGPWKPSIFMPRKASRITLELTEVRVERLRRISADDATAEGCGMGTNEQGGPVARYFHLWESINGPGSWAKNPWVWRYSFKML